MVFQWVNVKPRSPCSAPVGPMKTKRLAAPARPRKGGGSTHSNSPHQLLHLRSLHARRRAPLSAHVVLLSEGKRYRPQFFAWARGRPTSALLPSLERMRGVARRGTHALDFARAARALPGGPHALVLGYIMRDA